MYLCKPYIIETIHFGSLTIILPTIHIGKFLNITLDSNIYFDYSNGEYIDVSFAVLGFGLNYYKDITEGY